MKSQKEMKQKKKRKNGKIVQRRIKKKNKLKTKIKKHSRFQLERF